MNRRQWLRNAALLGAGVVAADQLELLDRLGWKRKFFPGWSPTPALAMRAGGRGYIGEFAINANHSTALAIRSMFDGDMPLTVEVDNRIFRECRITSLGEEFGSGVLQVTVEGPFPSVPIIGNPITPDIWRREVKETDGVDAPNIWLQEYMGTWPNA